jgi:hypothetical protein
MESLMNDTSWWDKSVFHHWIIIDRLADIILHYVKGCIVEIGIGRSSTLLIEHARKAGVKHYAVDISAKRCEWIKENARVEYDGLIVCNCSSFDFIETFDDVPALILLDGSHDSEIVIQEAMFFIHKMLPGGVMFLHDTCLIEDWEKRIMEDGLFSDTYRVRWELENLKNIWCFTWPYTAQATGLTMVMKRPEYEHTANPLDLVGDPEGQRMSGLRRWSMKVKN